MNRHLSIGIMIEYDFRVCYTILYQRSAAWEVQQIVKEGES